MASKNTSVDDELEDLGGGEDDFDFGGGEEDDDWTLSGEEEIDLSEVNENANRTLLKPGVYEVEIDSVEYKKSQRSGNPMLEWVYKGTLASGKTFRLWNHTVMTDEGKPRLKKTVMRTAPDVGLRFKPNDANDLFKGRRIRVRVKRDKDQNGAPSNRVVDILPPKVTTASFMDDDT